MVPLAQPPKKDDRSFDDWMYRLWKRITTEFNALFATFVPYAGATTNVDLGTHTISSSDEIIPTLSGNIITSTSVKNSLQQLDDSVTNQDNSGHNAWNSLPPHWSNVANAFTIITSGNGYIDGKKISWTAPQTVTIPANTSQLVYVDGNGTVQIVAVSGIPTDVLYLGKIPLFTVLYDGTNLLVTKEDHDYSFATDVVGYIHSNVGSVIQGSGANIVQITTGTGTAITDRELKIIGTDSLNDSELNTVIPDSVGAAITINFYYTNASGKWIQYASQQQMPMFYDNVGTVTAIPLNKYGIITIYVAKDNENSSTPVYVGVLDNTTYNNSGQANNAITSGTNATATNELQAMQMAQLGYVIIQNNASGGTISSAIIAKSTFSSKSVSGGVLGSAALVTVNTSTFSNVLTSADSTVQIALNDLDANWTQTLSAGTYTLPTITDNGNGTVTLGSGVYCFYQDASGTLPIKKYTIAGATYTLVDNSLNYLIANFNAGSPTITSTTSNSSNNDTTIYTVCRISRVGTHLDIIDRDQAARALPEKLMQRIVNVNGIQTEPNGFILGEVATRTVTVTSGYIWNGVQRIFDAAYNSSVNSLILWAHVAGVWTRSTITTYNNTQYDDGTNLQSLAASKYAVNWVFKSANSASAEECYIVLGGGNYNLPQAQASLVPANLPFEITGTAFIVGRIIVQQGASTATQIDSSNTTNFNFTQTTTATALASATTTVDVSASTAPTAGQVLTATSGTAAIWQTITGAGSLDTIRAVSTLRI